MWTIVATIILSRKDTPVTQMVRWFKAAATALAQLLVQFFARVGEVVLCLHMELGAQFIIHLHLRHLLLLDQAPILAHPPRMESMKSKHLLEDIFVEHLGLVNTILMAVPIIIPVKAVVVQLYSPEILTLVS
jgi:hypothetical protein